MIKILKIFSLFVLILFGFISQDVFGVGKCPDYNESNPAPVGSQIDGCLGGSKLVNPTLGRDGVIVSTGLKDKISKLTKNIGSLLALFAVGAIARGSFRMVISGGEDGDIKKGKEAVKWGILGFLVVVSSSAVILVVVEVMYSFGNF